VRIKPRGAGSLPILGLAIARQRDESNRRPQEGAELTADLIAVEVGEANVHEDDIRPTFARQIQSGGARLGAST